MTANQSWSTATRGGYREIAIRNGGSYNSDLIAGENTEDNRITVQHQSLSGIIELTSTSILTMWARQGSGVNLSVDASAMLRAVRIR